MSAEFPHRQPERGLNYEHYQRLAVIRDIKSEVTNAITALQAERPLEGDEDDLLTFIALSIHAKRIEELSDDILQLSEKGQLGTFINFSPAAFIRDALEGTQQLNPRVYQERSTEIIEIIVANTYVGTDAVLDLLLPSKEIDQAHRDLHFFPWRRDVLDRTGLTVDRLSNDASVIMHPTNISNIAIASLYKHSAQFPHRIAQVIK